MNTNKTNKYINYDNKQHFTALYAAVNQKTSQKQTPKNRFTAVHTTLAERHERNEFKGK